MDRPRTHPSLGLASAPETATRCLGLALRQLKTNLHGFVERVPRHTLAVARSNQLFVQTPVVDEDVRQETLVPISLLAVILQLNDLTLDGPLRERRRFWTKSLDRLRWMDRLWCVDADQSHAIVVLQDKSVTINNTDNSPDSTVFRDRLRWDDGIELILNAIPNAESLQKKDNNGQDEHNDSAETTFPALLSGQCSAFLNDVDAPASFTNDFVSRAPPTLAMYDRFLRSVA